MQAIGKAAESTALSMIREIVFGVGFAIILPIFFGLDGVLYSMPVSDVLTLVASLIVISRTFKQLSENEEENVGLFRYAYVTVKNHLQAKAV